MNLIISGELTAPKSEVGAFRSLTLYATMFKNLDCLVECKPEDIDFYYRWLKEKWSYDFVRQIVKPGEENGIVIRYSKNIEAITFDNLDWYITILHRA